MHVASYHAHKCKILNFISDVDECTIDSHSCDTRAECINTPGNFTCECQSGYAGDGMTCNGKT